MKKKRRLAIHYHESTSKNEERMASRTAYSESNPYFSKSSSTMVGEAKISEQARREYWPFLEPV
jgi:hypothetical protein